VFALPGTTPCALARAGRRPLIHRHQSGNLLFNESLATRLGLGIPRLSSANNPAATALAIVAILSIAVGLERVIRFRRPEKQLFDLNETLTRSLGGQYMQGYGQVFNAVMPLTGDIEDMV